MDKKLLLLLLVFLLVFAAFTGSLFLARQERTVRASKRVPVQTTSLCLSSALSARIGESAQITCVARDAETQAVSGAQCCFLVTSGNGRVSQNCLPTDNSGMAKTALTSSAQGVTQVGCQINGSISAGSVSVAFNP